MRTAIGVCVLLLQLGSIVYARFTPRRYFCWAPNDYVVEYQLEVNVAGWPLSPDQVMARYQLDSGYKGRIEHPAEHLMDNIEQYERTYGRNDRAKVRLISRYNGHPELREWRWPQ